MDPKVSSAEGHSLIPYESHFFASSQVSWASSGT